MSLCDQYLAARERRGLPDDFPDPTPEGREQAQDRIMARWLALAPSDKNLRLARAGATARVPQRTKRRLHRREVGWLTKARILTAPPP